MENHIRNACYQIRFAGRLISLPFRLAMDRQTTELAKIVDHLLQQAGYVRAQLGVARWKRAGYWVSRHPGGYIVIWGNNFQTPNEEKRYLRACVAFLKQKLAPLGDDVCIVDEDPSWTVITLKDADALNRLRRLAQQ